nr:uncharacterized protein LOC112777032 isoform X2 [Arachis hypogaea]
MTSPPSSSPCRPLCLLCQNHQRLPLRRSRLDGLNLGGELGRNLNFPSILEIDLSNNHIGGPIPFIFAIVNSQTLEEVARLKKVALVLLLALSNEVRVNGYGGSEQCEYSPELAPRPPVLVLLIIYIHQFKSL